MISEDEKYYVWLGMDEYGGDFVKGLSQALNSADHINREKIKKTWPDIWNRYLEMGKKLHIKKEVE